VSPILVLFFGFRREYQKGSFLVLLPPTLFSGLLLGDPSPSSSWLPLHRVWNSRGVSSDTTRSIEKTGMRAQKRFSGVAFTEATVLHTEIREHRPSRGVWCRPRLWPATEM